MSDFPEARKLIANQLRAVDMDEPESGYGAMANDLMQGDLMRVPTWVALECVDLALRRARASLTGEKA